MSNVIKYNTEEWRKGLNVPYGQTKINPIKHEFKTFPLVPETHPALKKKLKEFDFSNPPVDPISFASSLVETCKKNNGLGLSANQCGYEYRVFVMGSGENFVAFFNPKLISSSEQTIKLDEGCLSFKDLFLTVERPQTIEVEYQDFMGRKKTNTFSGMTARCFLHELDHMEGVCYTQRVKPLSLQMAMKKRQKLSIKRKHMEKFLKKDVDGNKLGI